jgi:GGDEF-like domain/PucR C-terminal helix-turn-helix domain
VHDWTDIAGAAAREAGPDPALLGGFLPAVARACTTGQRLDRRALAGFRALGARAAEEAVPLRALIDLYLSAAWRAWRHLPAVDGDDAEAVRLAGEIMLHAVDDAVAAVADGYEAARRASLQLEESARREFVDDLLGGTGDPAEMMARAERFGLDLTGPHAVAVFRGPRPVAHTSPRVSQASSALAATGAGDFLVTTRHDQLVAILPAAALVDALPRADGEQVGLGRTHRGVSGTALSYNDAVDALELAVRLRRPDPVVYADHLLIYRVLLRDREAIDDLIQVVLAPLDVARGGAGPLIDTIEAYTATGGNTTATAARLHLSARAVTYRLQRIRELTGHDPAAAQERFVLQAAVLGFRALPAEQRAELA